MHPATASHPLPIASFSGAAMQNVVRPCESENPMSATKQHQHEVSVDDVTNSVTEIGREGGGGGRLSTSIEFES